MRIFYFTPYDTAGLGVAYNRHCELVPNDDDWICIQDIDVMFFSSQQMGEQIEEAIKANPGMQAFTCMTTRLCARCQQQIQDLRWVREERDIVKLKQEADRRARIYRGQIEPVRGFFAGFFMVFQKKLWKRFPFPTVGSQGGKFLGVDSQWARTLRDHRIQVGMMKGLVAVHFYRLDTGETNISHLPDPTHNQKVVNVWDRPLRLGVAAPESEYPQVIPGPPVRIILNPSIRPPGGYRFRDGDGVTHTSTSLERLVSTVAAYRKRISRDPGSPEAEIVQQIYDRYPRCCIVTR